ncbi:MAG: hypothetical protein LBQ88_00430 [Treponema sp.]|jgi:hypothetical protein|nr:hypothetical protein [Treponema sp.]
MKRMGKIIISAVLLLAGGALFAQDNNSQGAEQNGGINRRPRQTPSVNITTRQAEELTISGKLSLVKGRIALQSGGTTYYLAGIDRLMGFIDGLKEGAEVTLEGFALNTQEEGAMLFRTGKLSINGKDYDLVPQLLSDARPDSAGETDAGRNRQGKGGNGPRQRGFSMQFNSWRHPGMTPPPCPGMTQPYGRNFNHGRQGFTPQRNQFRQELRQYRELKLKELKEKKQEHTPVPEENK